MFLDGAFVALGCKGRFSQLRRHEGVGVDERQGLLAGLCLWTVLLRQFGREVFTLAEFLYQGIDSFVLNSQFLFKLLAFQRLLLESIQRFGGHWVSWSRLL